MTGNKKWKEREEDRIVVSRPMKPVSKDPTKQTAEKRGLSTEDEHDVVDGYLVSTE